MNKANIYIWYLIISSLIKRFLSKIKIYNKHKSGKEIAILRTDVIGDYILFRNFLDIIKNSNKYKEYRITFIGNRIYKDLAEYLDHEFVDEFIWLEVPKQGDLEGTKNALKAVTASFYDVLIVPQHYRTEFANLISLAINAKTKIASNYHQKSEGFKNIIARFGFNKFISIPVYFRFEFLSNKYFFETLLEKNIGLTKPTIVSKKSSVKSEMTIVIGTGSSFFRRNWSIENYILLIKNLLSVTNCKILIIGAKSELDQVQQIFDTIKDPNLINLIGKTSLIELLDILESASLVIGNDTGIIHIAAALNTNTICFVGGGHFDKFFPYLRLNETDKLPMVIHHQMECFKCEWNCKYQLNFNETFPCINKIGFEAAWIAISEYLEQLGLLKQKNNSM